MLTRRAGGQPISASGYPGTYGCDTRRAMNQENETSGRLYLDDLRVGQRFASGVYEMTEERIKGFAAEFDPQPFHLDQALAETSIFRGLVASGWHTASVAMRLMVTGGLPFANGLMGLGGDIAWPRPTRPGDILKVESEIVEIRPSRSKPDRGIVSVRNTTRNQRGEEVQIFTAKVLVFRKPRAGEGTKEV
jgi:acyl dehydratase